MDALQDALDDLPSWEDDARKDKTKELRLKQRELRNFQQAKPVAQSPVETAPAVDNTAFQTAYDADWTETTRLFPQLGDETARAKDPLWIAMQEEHAKLTSSNDPILQSALLNSTVATRAAAKLGLTPRRADAPPAATPALKVVPGPAHGSPSGSKVVPVDFSKIKNSVPPHMLAAAMHGGY